MITLKRILAPTDFSRYAQHALRYAAALARRFGAELHLVYVLQDLLTMVPEPALAVPPLGDALPELLKAAREELGRMVAGEEAQGLAVCLDVLQGSPFVEIVRYAKDHDIDLIVIGTHGRAGISHLLLGSVAEKVVRKAPCPVLTVRHPEHEFVMP